jgi:hypothetical protein
VNWTSDVAALSCISAVPDNRKIGTAMTLRPRFKRGWLPLDDLELAQLYAEGRSFVFIAGRLRRSVGAVKWRIGYLKLKRADELDRGLMHSSRLDAHE